MTTSGLPELSLRSWQGGRNHTQSQSGEYYPCGGSTYTMRLTDWPDLEKPWSPFAVVHDRPLRVSARLSVGRYGSTLLLEIEQHHVRALVYWRGKIGTASAMRRALAYVYDRHYDLVREALSSYYGNMLGERTRSLIIGDDGTPLATFFVSSDAFNCEKLPSHFYQWRWRQSRMAYEGYEVTRYGSCRHGRASPEITAHVRALVARSLEALAESDSEP